MPHRPRQPPPWWPTDEAWPPQQGSGSWRGARGGPWQGSWRRRGRRRPPFGCAIVGLAIFATGSLTIGVWALAALVGLVSAPPLVLAGGLIALLVVIAATFAALRAVRATLAPVESLADAAERIEGGDYSVRVAESGPPRMRVLARAFNQMSARLEQSDAARRAFLADAAHEMRTPLSIIKGQVEAISDGIYPADAQHMAAINDQIAALERLIDDMRVVALAEAGALALDPRPLQIGPVIDEVVGAFAAEAAAVGVQLTADYPPRLPAALADEARIRQVLRNLLSNALRHTPAGGRVTVSADRASAGWLTVRVVDTGSGIPPELLPTVFDRFAKEPGSPGSGLGLAICRDLVEAHGGEISIDSEVGRGTTLTFTLPALESPT